MQKMSLRKTQKKQLQKTLNRLWAECALGKWGNVCCCGESAHCFHHFIPKSRCNNLRYDIMNAVPVCKACHWVLHSSPDTLKRRAVENTIIETRGMEWIECIDRKSKVSIKTNLMWLEEREALLKEALLHQKLGC